MIRFTPMASDASEHRNGRLPGGPARGPNMRQKYGETGPLSYHLPPEALGRQPSGNARPAQAQTAERPTAQSAPTPSKPAPAQPGPGGRTAHEDALFSQWRRSGAPITAVCMGGAVVRGRLLSFDAYGLIVDSPDGPTVLFKHGLISVCCPGAGSAP